jgi:hypothetical protein
MGRLFSAPYWIDAGRRATVAAVWLGCMKDYGIDLSDYARVRESGVTIYEHLASWAMPLASDATQMTDDEQERRSRLFLRDEGNSLRARAPSAIRSRVDEWQVTFVRRR